MSKQTGLVEKVENDWAWVETRRKGCCGHKSHFQMIEGMDRMLVKAKNSGGAGAGDEVELYIASKTKLKGLFYIYILPVAGLLFGALSAQSLADVIGLTGNFWLGFFTIAGFLAGVFGARLLAQRMAKRKELIPTVRKVIKRAGNKTIRPLRENISNRSHCTSCSGCSGTVGC